MLYGKRILLIVSGGIAACKAPELVRILRKEEAGVRCILTRGGSRFVTPLTLAALSEDTVYEDLFSLTSESEMGHIRLSREADLVLVAPATAHILARMAMGFADDLATTTLLATDKPVMVAPAMNVRMWDHDATRSNITTLSERGVMLIGPTEGEMACGEWGMGRMADPELVVAAVKEVLVRPGPLTNLRALVTSGATIEAIDPVRYLGNRSSGKQGHAIARALHRLGAATTLVSGPTNLQDPHGVHVIHVESARDMMAACNKVDPVDIVVCAAAVADWRPDTVAGSKIKKQPGVAPEPLALTENPDILAALSTPGANRPKLVIGFAAETDDVVANAEAKRIRKQCDWICANDVSQSSNVFGGDDNTIHLITAEGVEIWPLMSKDELADNLTRRIAGAMGPHT